MALVFAISCAQANTVTALQSDNSVFWFVSGNKIGLADVSGKTIHIPEFDYVTWFDENDIAFVESNKKKGAINLNGDIIIPLDDYTQIGYLKYASLSSNIIICSYSLDCNYLYSTEGVLIYSEPVEYAYPFINGKAFIKKNGMWNQIDINGNLVWDEWFDRLYKSTSVTRGYRGEDDNIMIVFDRNDNPFALYEKEEGVYNLSVFWNNLGKMIIKPQWDAIHIVSDANYAYKENGLWGICDTNGNTILEPCLSSVIGREETDSKYWAPDQTVAIQDSTGSYTGWASFDGTILVDATCIQITKINDELWMLEKNNNKSIHTVFVNNQASVLWELQTNRVIRKIEEPYIIYESSEEWGILDLEGKRLSSYQLDCYPICASNPDKFISDDGLIWIVEEYGNGPEYLYNVFGEQVILANESQRLSMSHHGYIRIMENGKYGFIDLQGNVTIEPRWDMLEPFEQIGSKLVSKASISYCWGYIDETGIGIAGDIEFLREYGKVTLDN